ncbi:1-acylglycerol-3-phosphate O-acyltransferase [Gnomoniopsis smithogilvyi]|uniref:1-acyl-sn-glycerol-3-phosphate acyltransferase n=1 Tax=Gnomoniopsis smithogilvyi TaxID=1191159 RepID=A0A9W8YVB9_9PEZI|nr:1-acylglycerol-3-phosphate O-acyltransferase [Gnomoniopsis smithogilvyi]
MSLLTYFEYFIIGYTALTVGLYVLSPMSTKAGFGARCLASYISMLIAAAYGVFASIALSLAGYRGISQWTTGRSFKWLMIATTGVSFEIIDPNGYLEKTRPAVFVGNHQTELDVLMLGTIFPKYCSVTAKSSLKKMPFLGWFMTLSGSVFIDRKNTKDAREAMKGAANQMQTMKQSVYMFPEGTRSYAKEPMLLPFKKGAFHLAVQAQVPIVPVVAANYSHVLYIKDFVFNAGKIPVKVLEPIPTKGLTAADVDQLCTKTREIMLEEIINLTYKARGQDAPIPASTIKASGVELKQ